MQRVYLTAGDTWPITGTISNSAGAMDITGWGIELQINYDTPATFAALLTDAKLGCYEIPFTADDLVAGEYDAVIVVTNSNNQHVTTSRIKLTISEAITNG